ncbi:DoxX family protein [Sphingomonas sabuli]|uniref:DoxX family protein n=1 Tax=Sphingomonas sabuli TaxID=2764186 RepID=UPI001FE7786D|nr:DoxX family protein [Sphingomonas sabuli]
MLRTVVRLLLAGFYFIAGVGHFAYPEALLSITPAWVPQPGLVIAATGAAEIAGAIGLVQPWSKQLRRSAGIGLALYALCVFPANINHMIIDLARDRPQLGWAYHGPRMLLQPLLIWLALWVSKAPRHAG